MFIQTDTMYIIAANKNNEDGDPLYYTRRFFNQTKDMTLCLHPTHNAATQVTRNHGLPKEDICKVTLLIGLE